MVHFLLYYLQYTFRAEQGLGSSHQCDLGSTRSQCHMCVYVWGREGGVMVLVLLRVFSSLYFGFPPSTKTIISKLKLD